MLWSSGTVRFIQGFMVPPLVEVRVPASTSNFGPGFDCLGCALQLYNTTSVRRVESSPWRLPAMLAETITFFFAQEELRAVAPFPVEVRVQGDTPASRGLGSSVTVRAGLLLGLAELVRGERLLDSATLLRWLIGLEGHPDNAVPSFLGGFAVCSPATEAGDSGYAFTRVPVRPELRFIALIPALRLSTEKARALLPVQVPFRQAVENLQRSARIAAIMAAGDYGALHGLFVDHLHQPFRAGLVPGFSAILEAASAAGALGSFLSGAGSTLLALALDREQEIGEAMRVTAEAHGHAVEVRVLSADNEGARVLA